jgi:four helix bundle protein
MELIRFNFEDLEVWRKSVEFAKVVLGLIEKIDAGRKHYRLIEQLEGAATSIALNIAEGKGRYSKREFVKFLYVARGSLYETITLLIILNKKNWINDKQLIDIKTFGDEIGKMLSGLINSIKISL